MANILNLTQHIATSEQVEVGVFEPADKKAVQALLTFNAPPSKEERAARAKALADMAVAAGAPAAMIGGAGYLMGPLEAALNERGIKPLHSFSQRESVDVPQPDGSVKKSQIFRHVGWVES